MVFRRNLIDLLSVTFRSVSSLARELGAARGDLEHDLRHAIRSARARGHDVRIVPARCKSCGFAFGDEKLSKPGRCPSCKGTRLDEPMIGIFVRGLRSGPHQAHLLRPTAPPVCRQPRAGEGHPPRNPT